MRERAPRVRMVEDPKYERPPTQKGEDRQREDIDREDVLKALGEELTSEESGSSGTRS